jgi:hypothetical protein
MLGRLREDDRFNDRSNVYQGMPKPEWLLALVVVFGLALPSGASGQIDTRRPIVDRPGTPETITAVGEPQLPPMQIPAVELGRPLSVAELRWCMSQEIGLQAIQPLLGTREAFDYQNELAKDFNRRCGARSYSREDSEAAAKAVAGARQEIVAAAIEDIQQLNDSALTRRIQEMLELLGYKLEVDGVYGAHTRELIQNFQLKVGIPADGLMSQLLLGRLQVEYLRILDGRE